MALYSSTVLIFVSIFYNLLFLPALAADVKFTDLSNEKTGKYEFLTEDGMRVTVVSNPDKKVDFRFGKLHFGVCLAYDSGAVLNASVEVYFKQENRFPRHVSTLSDDGKGVDLVSGDGCYFGVMKNCENSGHYNISITVQKTPTTCVVKEEKRLQVKINGGTQNVFYYASLGDGEFPDFPSGSVEIIACKKPLTGTSITDLSMDFNKYTYIGTVTWTDTWDAETVKSMVLVHYVIAGMNGETRGLVLRDFDVFPKYSKRSYVVDFAVLRGYNQKQWGISMEVYSYVGDKTIARSNIAWV